MTFDLSFVTDNHNFAHQVGREEEVAEVHKGPVGQEGRAVEGQQRSTHAMQEWIRHPPPTNSPSNQPDPGIPVIERIFACEAKTR